ncbi:MAG: hypothetical protein KDF56_14545, partial [Ottowia sp.]|nr:hypothetical protein [Ottowia sp.]
MKRSRKALWRALLGLALLAAVLALADVGRVLARLREALGQHGVVHAALGHGGFQQRLEAGARVGLALGVAGFQQH